jgi:hypothetical protein
VQARVAQGWYAALWSDPAHATKGRITTDRSADTYSLPAAAMQSPASYGRGLGLRRGQPRAERRALSPPRGSASAHSLDSLRRRSGRRLRVGAEVEAIVRGLTTAGTRNQPRCGASGRLPEHASSSHEAVAAPSLIRQDLASGSWPANATRKLPIAPA